MVTLKSLTVNIATIALFVSPFALFAGGRQALQSIMLTNVCLLVTAFLVPPWGWKLPHPYSDQEHLRRT